MINYIPSATGIAFHESDKFIKMVCGPYGSGKSIMCAMDLLYYACAQPPAADGVRYTRVGVIRATYRELIDSTRKSLLDVLPDNCGTITMSAATARGLYLIPLCDGTRVQLELNLIALRSPEDCPKILSMNWSFAWINEATAVSPEILTTVMSRIGRYPSQDMGGVNWGGIIMDFNQPDQGSWLDLYMKNPDDNWFVIKQPPAAFKKEDDRGRVYYEINPNAENLRNLGSREEGDPEDFPAEQRGMRYYRNQINLLMKEGREDKIQNLYCMLDVPVVDGKPVYPGFRIDKHVAASEIKPLMFNEILVGMDQSGIHPAAVILQNQHGKWCVMDELYAENEGFENFLQGMLVPLLREKYSTNKVIAAIDPSNNRDSWQAITPRSRLEDIGIQTVTEISNSPRIRIQAVEHLLNIDVGGLVVSPTCQRLIRGFTHEYRYRQMRTGGTMGVVYTPQPEKNDSSHYHDALQYAALLIQRGRASSSAGLSDVAVRLSEQRKVLHRVV